MEEYHTMDSDASTAEFITIPNTSSCEEDNFLSSRERTLALIELYKKYKPKVGTFQIKSMKKLWEIVARELSNSLRITINAARCENRWKTLERNYKKVVDNNNRTGRDRKVFEFEGEFDIIYGKKRNIKPSVLLSSNSTIATINRETCSPTNAQTELRDCGSQISLSISEEEPQHKNGESSMTTTTQNAEEFAQTRRKHPVRKVTSAYKKRNEILLEMKNDLKKYYEEKTQRAEQRLQLEKMKHEERVKRTKLLETILGENQ